MSMKLLIYFDELVTLSLNGLRVIVASFRQQTKKQIEDELIETKDD